MAAKKKGKKGKKGKKTAGKKKSAESLIVKKADIPELIERTCGADALLIQAIADNDNFMIAKIIDETPGIDVNRRNRDGWIPLHVSSLVIIVWSFNAFEFSQKCVLVSACRGSRDGEDGSDFVDVSC